MDTKELKALINLLDDPDEDVFIHVKDKLLSLGQEVIPVLENVWEMGDPFDTTVQTRIENIIHNIQFEKISKELTLWAISGSVDALKGAMLVAKYQYPDLDEEKIEAQLQRITQDIWLELNDNLTALEKVKILNHIVFDVHGFSGNTTNFHAPQNSYINNVLESKKGNPLSLSILYAIVAQRLSIPIYGVNLPQHFILAYQTDKNLTSILPGEFDHNVLFYVNPFSRGSIFSKKEIDSFLKQLNLEPKASYFQPCSNLDIIKRLLQNLVASYDKLGYPNKKDELQDLLNSLANL